MRSYPEARALDPEAIELLQECFDALQETLRFKRPSEEADDVARALVLAWQRGVRNKTDLMMLAEVWPLIPGAPIQH
jgi:hypothetical protein